MPESRQDLLEKGKRALEAAEWEDARAVFEIAIANHAGDPILLDGLSEAAWWLGDWNRSRELRENAYALHRTAGARVEAARAAMWLANEYWVATGNRPAWNGWLERAAGLLAGGDFGSDHGWLVFTRGRRADPAAAEQACLEALAIARKHADIDLEVVTLSQLGRALVSLGRMDEGFARLDEAMAAVTAGETKSYFTVCDTCCNMLTTCEGAGEIERLSQWCKVTDEVGRKLKGLTMYSVCRLNYASVLLAMGRIKEAEGQLNESLEITKKVYPAYTIVMLAKLAELRALQGRLDEAEELLAGNETSAAAVKPLALIRIAKGEPRAAASLIARRLGQLANDVLLAPPLLALLVEAKIDLGEIDAAREAALRLHEFATSTKRPVFTAIAELAAGRVALAAGEQDAWARLDRARELFVSLDMPIEAARARLAMARALSKEDPDAACKGARAARAELIALGVTRDADRAAELLRELGVGAGPGKRTTVDLSAREIEVLNLLGSGLSNAEIGKRLFISGKTVEHHVGKILAKLGVKGRAAAAAYAAKQLDRE